jgi:hypothetical protein
MDATVTIGEAADATGLTEDTLRYYERIGIVGEVERTASGHRRYSDQTLASSSTPGCIGRAKQRSRSDAQSWSPISANSRARSNGCRS